MIQIPKYASYIRSYSILLFKFFSSQRKRGRPPKTKSDGSSPVATYTKHPHVNPSGLILTPTINNQVILNEQHMKV